MWGLYDSFQFSVVGVLRGRGYQYKICFLILLQRRTRSTLGRGIVARVMQIYVVYYLLEVLVEGASFDVREVFLCFGEGDGFDVRCYFKLFYYGVGDAGDFFQVVLRFWNVGLRKNVFFQQCQVRVFWCFIGIRLGLIVSRVFRG